MSIEDIEKKAAAYADDRADLVELVTNMNVDVDAAKRPYLSKIRRAVRSVSSRHNELKSAIEAASELFRRPKTQKLAGVKVGFRKQKGQVLIADEEKTIKLIRKLLPPDQADLLIRQTESVDKNLAATLSGADLKRIGIEITKDTDVVVIKPEDAEVDKVVDALLKDAEKIEVPE